ncbi:MAG: hypothetical protein ACHQIK_14035 [Candidatus Acidiferrales bacterium]
MMKNILVRFGLLVAAILIVLPVNSSVKQLSSNRTAAVSVAMLSGSPLPIPNPPGFAIVSASGSPLPIPNPPGFAIVSASGSPLPIPNPPGFAIVSASGSPLPIPNPPGLLV